MPEKLGYRETEELSALRTELIEAMRSDVNVLELAVRYQELAETIANQAPDELARLGYDIAWALIKREGGRDAADDLDAAAMHAHQMGLDDIAELLWSEYEK